MNDEKVEEKRYKINYFAIAGMLVSCIYIIGNGLHLDVNPLGAVVAPVIMILAAIITILKKRQ